MKDINRHKIMKTLLISLTAIFVFIGISTYKSLANSTYIIDNANRINTKEKEQIDKIGEKVESQFNIKMIIYTENESQYKSDIENIINTVNLKISEKDMEKYILLIVYNGDIDAIEREKKLNVLNYGGTADPILPGDTTLNIGRKNVFPLFRTNEYSKACLNFYASVANEIDTHHGIQEEYKKLIAKPAYPIRLKENMGNFIISWLFLYFIMCLYRFLKEKPFGEDQIMKFQYSGDGLTTFRLPFKIKIKYRGIISGALIMVVIYFLVIMITAGPNSVNGINLYLNYAMYIPILIILVLGIIYMYTLKIELYENKVVLIDFGGFRKEILFEDIIKEVNIYGTYGKYSSKLTKNSIVIYSRKSKYPIVFPITMFNIKEILDLIYYINGSLVNIQNNEEYREKRDYKKLAINIAIKTTIIFFIFIYVSNYVINPLLDVIYSK